MATPDEHWWEAQAGEYVLGTLRGTERDVFEKILSVDAEVRGKVERWQRRLSDLDLLTPEIQPPVYLLPAILAKIHEENGGDAAATGRSSSLEPDTPAEKDNVVVHRRRERVTRRSNTLWKSVAGLATAATIAMAALLLQSVNRVVVPLNSGVQTVSVVQNDQQKALWVLTSQAASSQLAVIALAPPPIEADRSYQLWMVKPDNAGVNSVGLLPQKDGESMALTLPIPTDEAQLFAVSLEPKGGSPEAVPTGPVLFSGTIITLSSNSF